MGLNYRKKIKIAPGVNLNISKKGVSSVSIGKRGASLNINKHGSRATFGIPGSGISYTTKRTNKKSRKSQDAVKQPSVSENIAIGQNQVTVEQIINNKEHALGMMNCVNYSYEASLNKNPFLGSKKREQQVLLEQTVFEMQRTNVQNPQIKLSVEQVFREFSLLRFAKQVNFDHEMMSMYQAGLLIYIATRNNVTKKMRKEYLEDTIVELATKEHLLLSE